VNVKCCSDSNEHRRRRRFGLDDPDAMSRVGCNGTSAFVGLPEREASKIQDLWQRGEVGVELSVARPAEPQPSEQHAAE
jgi:hypothetical protein